MTPATSTLQQLYAAVLDAPAEDTLRLAYADALQECESVRVTCAACKGNGGFASLYRQGWNAMTRTEFGCYRAPKEYRECKECNGTGTIIDTSNADRAEFIRVGVGIAALKRRNHGEACTIVRDYLKRAGPGGQMLPSCSGCSDLSEEQSREFELIAAHRATWESVPCPEVRDPKQDLDERLERYQTHRNCPVCGGDGDLLKYTRYPGHTHCRPVQWERGFPVVSATSAEVWREEPGATCHLCHGRGGWQTGPHSGDCPACDSRGHTPNRTVPTPWAKAVSQWAVGIRLTDVEPVQVTGGPHKGDFFWVMRGWEHLREHLPNNRVFSEHYPTREAADLALAYAVAQWARGDA